MKNIVQNKLNEEILRMLKLSGAQGSLVESAPKNLLKEDSEEDLTNIFGKADEDGESQESKFSTSGQKVILPIELKAAMLSHSFSEYEAALLGIYSASYSPKTKGTTTSEDPDALYDKMPVQKVSGAESELNRLNAFGKDANVHEKGKRFDAEWEKIIKSRRVPVTFSGDEIKTREMTGQERGYLEKWWLKKTYDMISYSSSGGLTPTGKAQLEFLARAYTGKPIDEKEKELFNILKDGGGHFSEVAESIIREFYTLVMIPYIMNLTKRAKYNPNDFQLKIFIENGINRALDQLGSYYDPSRGNLGSFIITVVKNDVKNQLKSISEYKLDLADAYEYLSNQSVPFRAYSIARPEDVEGSYNDVKMVKGPSVDEAGRNRNALYAYIYNEPTDAIEDLTKDARSHNGKPSPLAKRFIQNPTRSLFFKSFAPDYDKIKGEMGYEDTNPYESYNIFSAENIPAEAKKAVTGVLNRILVAITDNYGKDYGLRNINSFIVNNTKFIKELMMDTFNYGDFVEVYTKTWAINNDNGGVTKIPAHNPVQYIKGKNGDKAYVKNVNGDIPTENDTEWIWSAGEKSEEDVKNNFINKFLARVNEKYKNAGEKFIPDEFKEKGKDIFNKLYGAIRYYFGYQGKNNPAIKKNISDLNLILKNYSSAVVANQTINELKNKK